MLGVRGGKLLCDSGAVSGDGAMRIGPVLRVRCIGVLGVRGGKLLRDSRAVGGDGSVCSRVVLRGVGDRVHVVRCRDLPERKRCECLPELCCGNVRNSGWAVGVFKLR